MADDTSKKKKPLWHKWWFWAIIGVVLVLGVSGQQEDSSKTEELTASVATTVPSVQATTVPTSPSPSKSADSSPSPSESDQWDPMKVLNSVAQSVGIAPSDVVSFKPDEEYNQNGTHSRIEYRLPAFQGSLGAHATLNGASVDVVEYDKSSSIRIYATGDENTVLSIYSAAAKVFDSSLSDSDIQSAIAEYKSSEEKDLRDGLTDFSIPRKNGKIQGDYIIGTPDYIINSGSNCEIFIDAEERNHW